MSDQHLLRACEIVAQKDTQPLRRALFEQLSSRTPALRAARAVWERLGPGGLGAAFVGTLALERVLEVRFPGQDADLLAVGKYENERRQFAALGALDPTLHVSAIALRPSINGGPPRLDASVLREGWSAIRDYANGGDFLVAARVAETVGYYLAMLPQLARHRAPAVLVSSDTNPYATAFVHAARRLGRKTCFVTHGHVAEGPPPLDFDVSLLDGPAVRDVYQRAGPIRGAVVFKGSEGVVAPMDASRLADGAKTLGVVLSILVDWRRVATLVRRLQTELRPKRTVVRLHPNRTLRDPRWAEAFDPATVRVSMGQNTLVDDVAGCQLVVAGNTSAHLTVLKAGIPTVYLPGVDEIGEDYYGFVRDGIVAAANDGSIDIAEIRRFYDDPGWPARFARFDAGYPDRQAACDRAVVEALRGLVTPRKGRSA